MPVLTFAVERIPAGHRGGESVTLPDAIARALVDAMDGKPLVALTTEHLAVIVGLARGTPHRAGLDRLADAIVEHRRVFVRFR
ncbi:MAG: hypothetical protein WCK28_01745 [Burkholderiales bacterium]|jgi:hypothetical protein